MWVRVILALRAKSFIRLVKGDIQGTCRTFKRVLRISLWVLKTKAYEKPFLQSIFTAAKCIIHLIKIHVKLFWGNNLSF